MRTPSNRRFGSMTLVEAASAPGRDIANIDKTERIIVAWERVAQAQRSVARMKVYEEN